MNSFLVKKEKWKCIKTFDADSKYYNKNDKIYISSLGRYKLNDTILTLGFGLVYSNDDIKPYKVIKESTYRLVYENFSSEIPITFTIHHIDHNHFNNDIRNLACIPVKQHASIHKHDKLHRRQIINAQMCKELRKTYKQKSSYYRNSTKDFLRKIKSLGT